MDCQVWWQKQPIASSRISTLVDPETGILRLESNWERHDKLLIYARLDNDVPDNITSAINPGRWCPFPFCALCLRLRNACQLAIFLQILLKRMTCEVYFHNIVFELRLVSIDEIVKLDWSMNLAVYHRCERDNRGRPTKGWWRCNCCRGCLENDYFK